MAIQFRISAYTELPSYTFKAPQATVYQSNSKIISPSGRVPLVPAESINAVPCQFVRPQASIIPLAAADFKIGDFPAVITPQTALTVPPLNIGVDIQARIQAILNPQELAVTTKTQSRQIILELLDEAKLELSRIHSKGYSAKELKDFARALGLPTGNKEQNINNIFQELRKYRGEVL